VYNRGASACGYCGKARSENEERTTSWGLPPAHEAWVLERIHFDDQQAQSRKHRLRLPNQITKQPGHLPIGRSGLLLLILRAIGFSWSASYRTAAIAFQWVGSGKKLSKVLASLIASEELSKIRDEADRVYNAWVLENISQDLANNTRSFLKKTL
jgi:hypothetical protein